MRKGSRLEFPRSKSPESCTQIAIRSTDYALFGRGHYALNQPAAETPRISGGAACLDDRGAGLRSELNLGP